MTANSELYGFIIRAAIGAMKVSPMFYDHANKRWLCYCCRSIQMGDGHREVPGVHSGECEWFLLWRFAREFSHEPWARHGSEKELDTLKQWYWQRGATSPIEQDKE